MSQITEEQKNEWFAFSEELKQAFGLPEEVDLVTTEILVDPFFGGEDFEGVSATEDPYEPEAFVGFGDNVRATFFYRNKLTMELYNYGNGKSELFLANRSKEDTWLALRWDSSNGCRNFNESPDAKSTQHLVPFALRLLAVLDETVLEDFIQERVLKN